MIERIFSPLLAFTLLVGGTVAVGSELFRDPQAAADAAVAATVRLPRVEVTGHRAAAAVATATLPRVEITARRAATSLQLADSTREPDCTTEEAAASGAPAAHI